MRELVKLWGLRVRLTVHRLSIGKYIKHSHCLVKQIILGHQQKLVVNSGKIISENRFAVFIHFHHYRFANSDITVFEIACL